MKKSILTTALLGTLAFGIDMSKMDILGITINHTGKQAIAIAQKQGYKCKANGVDFNVSQWYKCNKEGSELTIKSLIDGEVLYASRDDTLKQHIDVDIFKNKMIQKYGNYEHFDYSTAYDGTLWHNWGYGDCIDSRDNTKVYCGGNSDQLCIYIGNYSDGHAYMGTVIGNTSGHDKQYKLEKIKKREAENKKIQNKKEATSNMQL
jgi:hypothetical protein